MVLQLGDKAVDSTAGTEKHSRRDIQLYANALAMAIPSGSIALATCMANNYVL